VNEVGNRVSTGGGCFCRNLQKQLPLLFLRENPESADRARTNPHSTDNGHRAACCEMRFFAGKVSVASGSEICQLTDFRIRRKEK